MTARRAVRSDRVSLVLRGRALTTEYRRAGLRNAASDCRMAIHVLIVFDQFLISQTLPVHRWPSFRLDGQAVTCKQASNALLPNICGPVLAE